MAGERPISTSLRRYRVVIGDNLDACRRPVKEMLALYIGGMGARDKTSTIVMPGVAATKKKPRRSRICIWAVTRKKAIAAVPDRLVDQMALVGPLSRVRDRAQVWKQLAADGQIGTMILKVGQAEMLEPMINMLND